MSWSAKTFRVPVCPDGSMAKALVGYGWRIPLPCHSAHAVAPGSCWAQGVSQALPTPL